MKQQKQLQIAINTAHDHGELFLNLFKVESISASICLPCMHVLEGQPVSACRDTQSVLLKLEYGLSSRVDTLPGSLR